MTEKDEDLIRRVAGGDAGAYDTLVARHQGPVFNTILRFVHDRSEAESLCQEVLFKVYQSAGTFAGRSLFTTWLYRIATNLCLNHVKRKRPVPSEDLERFVAPNPEPGEQLLENERAAAIRAAIESLPPRQRMAVLLHRFEGLRYKEIAETLECPLSSVESLIHRAYVRLRKKLTAYAAGK